MRNFKFLNQVFKTLLIFILPLIAYAKESDAYRLLLLSNFWYAWGSIAVVFLELPLVSAIFVRIVTRDYKIRFLTKFALFCFGLFWPFLITGLLGTGYFDFIVDPIFFSIIDFIISPDTNIYISLLAIMGSFFMYFVFCMLLAYPFMRPIIKRIGKEATHRDVV